MNEALRQNMMEQLEPYLNDKEVLRMEKFIQHGTVSTYQHGLRVAFAALLMAHVLHLQIDERSLLIGAFLHDFYLYDWHTDNPYGKRHGFIHPELARENAVRCFDIDEKQQSIIRSHMWPMTLKHPPQCKEGWLVVVADKYCTIEETLFMRK